jgi:hypothetical protein
MLGIDSQWKWSVDGIDGYTIPATTQLRAGIKAAERAIDKALAPKKKRLQRPQ